MSHLLDVNLLLACAWSSHSHHARANRWLNTLATFATAPVTHGSQVTDAHLVRLAAAHSLKLATLDATLCRQPWASQLAENPF